MCTGFNKLTEVEEAEVVAAGIGHQRGIGIGIHRQRARKASG